MSRRLQTLTVVYLFCVVSSIAAAADEPTGRDNVTSVTLRDVVGEAERKLAEVVVRGKDIHHVTVTVTSKSDSPLAIAIEPGTIAVSQSGSYQNMMLLAEADDKPATIALPPRGEATVDVTALCLNMRRQIPTDDNEMTILTEPPELRHLGSGGRPMSERRRGDLLKLLGSKMFWTVTDYRRQCAVWTVTENPADEYGYARIVQQVDGVTLSPRIGEGLGETALNELATIFDEADVFTSRYDVLAVPGLALRRRRIRQAIENREPLPELPLFAAYRLRGDELRIPEVFPKLAYTKPQVLRARMLRAIGDENVLAIELGQGGPSSLPWRLWYKPVDREWMILVEGAHPGVLGLDTSVADRILDELAVPSDDGRAHIKHPWPVTIRATIIRDLLGDDEDVIGFEVAPGEETSIYGVLGANEKVVEMWLLRPED